MSSATLYIHMAGKLLSNIHNQLPQNMQNQELMDNIGRRLLDLGSRFGALPALLTGVQNAVSGSYLETRQRISRRLSRERKKYKLALESLGWGTIADLIESAFAGKILNIIV